MSDLGSSAGDEGAPSAGTAAIGWVPEDPGGTATTGEMSGNGAPLRASSPDVTADDDQLTTSEPDLDLSTAAADSAGPHTAQMPAWHGGMAFQPPLPPLLPLPLTWRQRRIAAVEHDKAYRSNVEIVSKILGAAVVLGVSIFVIWQLRPDLIFGPGVDVGGDNGGHIAAPYFMIHHLLNHGQVTGWDPWWFDGFPLYVFYFPLPALFVGALNLVFPYAVAFKIVTVLGTATLPLCAWAFGALAGFRRPAPVLMSAAMLPFLFNTSYTIDGGNITSTMAGEFSFSLSMSFGLLFLGVFAYGLRTGRLRWLAAGLFAATVLCHVVPALAFAGVAVLFAAAAGRASALKIIVPVGIVGALLAAFWLVPFGADLQFTSSMNYQPVAGLSANLNPTGWIWMIVPAGIGVLIAIAKAATGRHNVLPVMLGVAALGSGAAFGYLPSGLVYNGRWLPFWFLFVCLLAAYGLAEVCRTIAAIMVSPVPEWAGAMVGSVVCIAGAAAAGGLVGAFPFVSPDTSQTQVQGWIDWNYTGYQAKSGWPQYEGMIAMLDKAGKHYGCGRLQYEYISETTDPFGSTEAMMALPMQTNGCMATTDGIYFESSTTTPFHFLNVSEVSQDGEAPDPISGLEYPGFDLPDGIRHLQLMGDRYFLAMSPPVEAAAAIEPDLVKIAQTPGFIPPGGNINNVPDPHPVWNLYLIKDSALVTPLRYEPVVETMKASDWLHENETWYEDDRPWPVPLARSGPANWPRVAAGKLVPISHGIPTPGTTVSDISQTDSSISFHVSTLGSPVLVKIPYFPNWHASGATGPYEVSPNLMAVVPTSHTVSLSYGSSPADWIGKAGSLLGVAGFGALLFRPKVDVGPDPTDEPASPYANPFANPWITVGDLAADGDDKEGGGGEEGGGEDEKGDDIARSADPEGEGHSADPPTRAAHFGEDP